MKHFGSLATCQTRCAKHEWRVSLVAAWMPTMPICELPVEAGPPGIKPSFSTVIPTGVRGSSTEDAGGNENRLQPSETAFMRVAKCREVLWELLEPLQRHKHQYKPAPPPQCKFGNDVYHW